MSYNINQVVTDIEAVRRRLKRKGELPNKVLFDKTRFTMKPKPIPTTMRARKPNGPMNTLEAMKKGDVILVDRVTGNRLRATASQRRMPFKSRTEGDKIRIWRTGK